MKMSVKITIWLTAVVTTGVIVTMIAVGVHNRAIASQSRIADPVPTSTTPSTPSTTNTPSTPSAAPSTPSAPSAAPDRPTPTDNCGESGVTCATAPVTTENPVVAPESTATTAQAPDTVVYTVTTSGHTRLNNVTYLVPGTFQEGQDTSTSSPWSKTFTLTGSEFGSSYSLIAQNAGSGSITCTITDDGQTVTTNTSTGPYAVVTCEGG